MSCTDEIPGQAQPQHEEFRVLGAIVAGLPFGILAGTVTVLTPVFLIIAYLPAIMRASGAWIVVVMLGYVAARHTRGKIALRIG